MSIETYLKQIYPAENTLAISKEIDGVVKKYSSVGYSKKKPDHQDVVLITYADSIQEKGVLPLRSLKKFLDHTLESEISSVHILPFYPFSSDDGFSVIDYKKVKESHGSWENVKDLTYYRLMFDAVINHISSQSEWLKGFLNDDPEYANHFIEEEDGFDIANVTRPRTSPLFHAFKKSNGIEVRLWTTFSEDQLDINFANPNVLLKVLDVLGFYISQGASMLRLDAIGFMWKKSGTTCIHLPETHAIIKLIREVLTSIDPNVQLITETNVPHKENISYFGNGRDEAHMVYNFTLPPLLAYSILSGSSSIFSSWARELKLPGSDSYFFNFLSSHDGIGVRPVEDILSTNQINILIQAAEANGGKISYKSNPDGSQTPYEINCNYNHILFGREKNETLGIQRTILAHAVLLVMPGIPAIYIHSLLGSLNDLEGMKKTGRNRTINRATLDLPKLEQELNRKGSYRNKVFSSMMEITRKRKEMPDLHPSSKAEIMDLPSPLFGIKRGENFQAYFNFSNDKIRLKDQKKGEILLDPYGFHWTDN